MKTYIKLFDILIILIVAVFIVFSIYSVYFQSSGNPRVFVQGREGQWIFPINAEETIIFSGPLGDTVVRLSENLAWVESSPCQNQNCVASGKISGHGQWTACLPNNVILIINNANNTGDNDVDGVSW